MRCSCFTSRAPVGVSPGTWSHNGPSAAAKRTIVALVGHHRLVAGRRVGQLRPREHHAVAIARDGHHDRLARVGRVARGQADQLQQRGQAHTAQHREGPALARHVERGTHRDLAAGRKGTQCRHIERHALFDVAGHRQLVGRLCGGPRKRQTERCGSGEHAAPLHRRRCRGSSLHRGEPSRRVPSAPAATPKAWPQRGDRLRMRNVHHGSACVSDNTSPARSPP